MAEALTFTGERYVPGHVSEIAYEHLHRYDLCVEMAAERRVVDIACGEGYGSVVLARRAASVIGVDIDPEVVEHASTTYASVTNARFLCGSCADIPLPSASADMVVSFETIEHHDQHEEMLSEIRRVLQPDGLLVISTPNRLLYTDAPDFHNPFHVKELYRDEFVGLLARHFGKVELYGQRTAIASFIYPTFEEPTCAPSSYLSLGSQGGKREGETESIYFVAVCGPLDGGRLPQLRRSVYTDPTQNLFSEMHAARWKWESEAWRWRQEAEDAAGRITAMEGSKFWAMRNAYCRLRDWATRRS